MKNKRKRKKKTNKKINVIGIISIILILVLLCFIGYKINILNKYDIEKLNLDNYDEFLNAYNSKSELTIDHVTLNENEYLTYLNVKVKNILGDGVEENYLNNTSPQVYFNKKDASGNIVDTISISIIDSYITIFTAEDKNFMTTTDSAEDDIPLEAEITDYLTENNITNDLELIKFLSETRNYKPNIFTSTNKIKNHYGTHLMASITMPKIDSFTVLNGQYQGYIYSINNYQQISIEKDNEQYIFLLKDKTSEETLEFLNSIVIS